jgi:exodeoxyribonuclease VII large subunit
VAVTLNPDAVLQRGYARVEKRGGGTVMNARDAKAAGALSLRFADGAVDVKVERSGTAPYIAAKPQQPDLF